MNAFECMNVFAYTAPGGNYPEYISVNVNRDGSVDVIVRSKAENGNSGDTASITLEPEQVVKLKKALP